MPQDSTKATYDPIRGFYWGALILVAMTIASTLGYWLLGLYYGRSDWDLMACLFMVVITLSTIGYGDWLDIRAAPIAQIFTIVLVGLGVGVHAFVISNITALMFEGLLGGAWRRRRMHHTIAKLSGHIIVCGTGATGTCCIEELRKIGRPFVVIDHDPVPLERLATADPALLYVAGPADDDATLRRAGIERASGLLACLDDDKLNLYVSLSARQLNPALRIVSKLMDEQAAPKLRQAGADEVVSPSKIGGLRMVSVLVRPTVVGFLDTMLRDPTQNYRFDEITIDAASPFAGKSIDAVNPRRHGDLLVVAVREPAGARYVYSPPPNSPRAAGPTIVGLGRAAEIAPLRAELSSSVGRGA